MNRHRQMSRTARSRRRMDGGCRIPLKRGAKTSPCRPRLPTAANVRRLLLAAGCLVANAVLMAASHAQGGQEAEAQVRAVIERYAQGTFEGDAEKLRSTFHAKAVMNGYLNGQLLLATPAPFIAEMSKAPLREAGAPYEWEIADLQMAGKVASATLKETGFLDGSGFTSYFHLIDDGDGWRIISKLFTQHPPPSPEEPLARLEAAGLPASKSEITAYFSEGFESRALAVRPLMEEAMGFHKEALGVESSIAIAILNAADWSRFAEGIPYGLPFVSGAATPVAFIPATDDGVLVQGAGALRQQASEATLEKIAKTGLGFTEGASAFVDAIILHELGHVLVDAYGIQPASKWFEEFLATYFAYAFLQEKRPDLARIFEIYAYHLNRDGAGPQSKSLARFEAEYAGMDAQDYAWYQGMFLGLVMQLHDKWRMKLLPTVQQRFPADSGNAPTAASSSDDLAYLDQELKALAEISTAFPEWAAALQ